MTKTKDKVADAAGNVKPYVQRAIGDEDLRDNVKAAFQAAREVYDELIGNRSVTTVATRVATDREIQDKLKDAVDELREATKRVQGKKKDHGSRNATLLVSGIALGILFNPVTGPATRKWLADTLFGGNDFTYDTGPNGGAGGGTAA